MMKQNFVFNNSIAVLPFVNMSADADKEYFSDGITEEIINALARIKNLKVTSRTSSFFFKNQRIPLKQIAKQLDVEIILEGSVRIADNKLRITAQLIQAEDDSHFWSETWNRKLENIFEIQDEISLQIADKLREQLGHMEYEEHLIGKQTQNLDAYSLYLKGLFYFNKWNPEDVILSINYFEQAIALDPNHIESLVGLADAYSFLGTIESYPREEAYIKTVEFTQKAHALNNENADVHYQLANLSFFTDCSYSDALKHIDYSLKLKPNYPEALQFKSFLCMLTGEMDTAHRYIQLAIGINPLSAETLFYKAYYLYRKHNYIKAEKTVDEILSKNAKNIPAIITKAYCMLKLQQFDLVLDFIDEALTNNILPDEKLGIKCLAYILKGDAENGMQLLAKLKAEAKKPHSFQAHSYLFLALVSLNRFDDAFAWLEKALQMKSSIIMLIFSDPLSEKIREDSRFKIFADKMYKGSIQHPAEIQKTPLLDDQTAANFSSKLLSFLKIEEPYLNPTLSLRTLSDMIEIHPNKLSWLLNEKHGKKFNEFINSYRLAHFKELAKNPENSHISIIGLAYESGFNSKTVFNTFFKKAEGITPNDYLRKLKKNK